MRRLSDRETLRGLFRRPRRATAQPWPADPRDTAPAERLADLAGGDGVYRCHTIFNCIDACPKNLNPTQAIETLRKLAQKRQAMEEARQERQKTLALPVKSEE